jgi:nitrogen regulatory protein P-II 1
MEFRKVIAILRPDYLEKIGQPLQALAVPGIGVSTVKGYGEYMDFYKPDWMSSHVRIEIFTPREQARAIAEVILDAAHTGLPGDGIVAIQPVETVFEIESRLILTGRKEGLES